MKFISSRNGSGTFTLSKALKEGLAPDGGLFMPEKYPEIYTGALSEAAEGKFHMLAYNLAKPYLDEDFDQPVTEDIVKKTFDFEVPLLQLNGKISVLELFHGPTLAFKDFGARFMARLIAELNDKKEKITVLVATSGDTGGAVASGFHRISNIEVIVLYPDGKVSEFQKKQFTSLGNNITCLAVQGNFDDCQRLVKRAFADRDLRQRMKLTSANSINIGRWLPQSFYYTWAQLKWSETNPGVQPVCSVPSGNYGNLTAGMLAIKTGTPIEKIIAASTINNTVPVYLQTGIYNPKESVPTICNAMDVGDPSNFERMRHMGGSRENITGMVSAFEFVDKDIKKCIEKVYYKTGYILDPHSATGYLALEKSGRKGFFLATAHPVKFLEVLPDNIGKNVTIPEHFKGFSDKSMALKISTSYEEFREFLSGR